MEENEIVAALLADNRLEDAFKAPVCNEEGYSESMPVIWSKYSYGRRRDGILVLGSKSASIASNLYSRYLDEPALVWDDYKKRLFLYQPNLNTKQLAFKGDGWRVARKLKPEFQHLSLAEIYHEMTRADMGYEG